MDATERFDTPPLVNLPQAIPPHLRIAIPLSRVLDFARQESDAQPSRHLANALRPLLAVALATAGHCQGLSPELPEAAAPGAAPAPGPSTRPNRPGLAPGHAIQAAGTPSGRPPGPPSPHGDDPCAVPGTGDPEILFTALSSLVEVVKSLTPTAGRIYAHLGHEAHSVQESDELLERIPRSEVVIELVSIASPAFESLSPAVHNALGALAFELAVVAAILESKGGQLHLVAPKSHSRRFVVRLPVWGT